jgi:predicted metal-dependent hydrolase
MRRSSERKVTTEVREVVVIDDLRFALTRSSRRKTLEIGVDRQGELTLAVPTECSRAKIERFARERKFWVYTKLAEKERLFKPRSPKEFVEGEGFLYLGRSYRLKYAQDQAEAFKLVNGRLCAREPLSGDKRKSLVDWYSERLKNILVERLRAIVVDVGNRPTGVRVQDLGFRWGSCGKAGNVYFHWKVALLPLRIIDYVIAHELVHLKIAHHTPEFWKKLERSMPDYEQRKDWLAKHGVETDGY